MRVNRIAFTKSISSDDDEDDVGAIVPHKLRFSITMMMMMVVRLDRLDRFGASSPSG